MYAEGSVIAEEILNRQGESENTGRSNKRKGLPAKVLSLVRPEVLEDQEFDTDCPSHGLIACGPLIESYLEAVHVPLRSRVYIQYCWSKGVYR